MLQYVAAKGKWDFRISDLVKTLMELTFNSCGEFRWSPEDPVSQIHTPYLPVGATGLFLDLSKSFKVQKRVEWGKQREATAPIGP